MWICICCNNCRKCPVGCWRKKTRHFFRDVIADCDGKHPDYHPLSGKLQEGFCPARFLPGLDFFIEPEVSAIVCRDLGCNLQPDSQPSWRGRLTGCCMTTLSCWSSSSSFSLAGRYLITPSAPLTRSTLRLKKALAPRKHFIFYTVNTFLSRYCEGCMACLTAYIIYFCAETHYEKCLKKVSRFVHEQNEQVYNYKT